jgi:hypothetical protein
MCPLCPSAYKAKPDAWRGSSSTRVKSKSQQARDCLVLREEQDRYTIHKLSYQIKGSYEVPVRVPVIEALTAKYQGNHFIAGRMELHPRAKHFARADESRNSCGSRRPIDDNCDKNG